MNIANARDLGFSIEEIGELLTLWSDEHRVSSEVKPLALAKADELGRKAEVPAATVLFWLCSTGLEPKARLSVPSG